MPQKPGIQIALHQIPTIADRVPLLKTTPVVDAPAEFVRAQAQRLVPNAAIRDIGTAGATGIFDGERLVGFSDPSTGESHIVPLLEGLQPGATLSVAAAAGARSLLSAQASLFGGGSEQVIPSAPIELMAATVARGGARTEPTPVLATVKLTRQINGLDVYGPGSNASAAFSSQGLVGFSHRWTSAQPTADAIQAHPPAAIRDRIVEHIGTLAETRPVQLHDATSAYYDDGAGHIQPVYRYRISTPSADGKTAPAMYIGYVPIGEQLAALPALHPVVTTNPAAAQATGRVAPAQATGGVPQSNQIKIGRYVVRQDDSGWVASANTFWDKLQQSGGPFVNSQYFWAEPRLFLAEKDSFVNSVHVALTEVHGGWGVFSTLQNDADFVYLSSIPTSGYGADGGPGSLAYWILHSCEVIPTSTDETTSYDVWWNIFNGLHAAMGYRTEMYINDQVSSMFGTLLAHGAPVVSSWLSSVVTNGDYQHGDTYTDGYRNIVEPMGRPSAIAVSGHGDDTVRMVTPLPKPGSLTEWWYNN